MQAAGSPVNLNTALSRIARKPRARDDRIAVRTNVRQHALRVVRKWLRNSVDYASRACRETSSKRYPLLWSFFASASPVFYFPFLSFRRISSLAASSRVIYVYIPFKFVRAAKVLRRWNDKE